MVPTNKRKSRSSSAAVRLALAALGLPAALGLAEAALAVLGRRADWRYCTGWAEDDLDCRYRLKPGVFDDFGAGPFRVSSLGTRGPEPDHPLALCLGDSCTFGVQVPDGVAYPALLDRRPGAVVNAGVPGYNAFLGAQWLRRSRVLDLHPKLVTLYYGWNDHRRAAAPERLFFYVRRLSPYSRLASYLLRWQESIWSEAPVWKRRRWFRVVPLLEFKRDLAGMVREIREAGAEAVLITAPYEARLLSPSIPAEELQEHVVYAEAVRQVALETGAGLVDFEKIMQARAAEDPKEYFLDYVHLNARGHAVLAGLLKPWLRCAEAGACAGAARPW